MSWFKRRKSIDDDSRGGASPGSESRGLLSGLHRSPALAILVDELTRHPPRSILDLGTSSTENVNFLSRFCDQISIQDLFQSTENTRSGSRSTIFRFEEDVIRSLPGEDERFDLVLLWDLLHYFERAHIPRLIAELKRRCREDALVYLLASTVAPIPLTPIRFKIHDSETLDYFVAAGGRAAPPQLRTRDVEIFLGGFEPEQLFQLRNGLQEFVFRFQARSLDAGTSGSG